MWGRFERLSHRVLVLAAAASLLAACAGSSTTAGTPTRLVVGALHVGSIKDAGYNEAQHDGLMKMKEKVPGIKLLEAENVPEAPTRSG
jgi:basic membrane lipoprotein Med (substrate-binding protein (PBP1-ABC) superfamily)